MSETRNGSNQRRMFIANIDGSFFGPVTGQLARKCRQLAPRMLHCLERDDSVVLYERPPEAYLDYYEQLYGYRPDVICPRSERRASAPLDMLGDVLADASLTEIILGLGAKRPWSVVPFVDHARVYEFADRVGLPVVGTARSKVEAGLSADLNDKIKFQERCRKLGLPVPKSTYVRGFAAIHKSAASMLEIHDGVMIRRARAAGGLGNIPIESADVRTEEMLTAFLRDQLQPANAWEADDVLVEPLLRVDKTPTSLFFAGTSGVRLIAEARRELSGGYASKGGYIPSNLTSVRSDQMIDMGRRYGEDIARDGAYGYFDIDWGVANGMLVAFESNFRMTGNNHHVAIRQRLRPDNASGLVSASFDDLDIREGLELSHVLERLERHALLYDSARGCGVIVTVPPNDGTVGYVALAESSRDLAELANRTKLCLNSIDG